MGYSLFWRIPALILIALLLERDRFNPFRPGKGDLPVLALCLPVLCLTGFLTALAAQVTGLFPGKEIPAPRGSFPWTSVILTSLCAGYLEEGYFRLYLPRRFLNAGLGTLKSFAVPVLVFGLLHAWEGPWGFANALLAGLFLSLVYNKTASFHGIALAHGLYNTLVYLAASRSLGKGLENTVQGFAAGP
ncbi:MAG: CPBP family intramembrane metalloprotease [Treponema sp.]|nr:CPBP family intramembrane metalloprotease [Treponema sp.]